MLGSSFKTRRTWRGELRLLEELGAGAEEPGKLRLLEELGAGAEEPFEVALLTDILLDPN